MVSDRPRNGRYKKSDIQTPADPVSNSFMGSLRESQSKNNNGTNSRLKEAAGSRAGMTDIEQDLLLGSTPIELSKGSTKSASTASGGAATAGSATTVTQYAPYQESLKKPLIGGGSSSIIMKPSSSNKNQTEGS